MIDQIVISPTLEPAGHIVQVFVDSRPESEIAILKIDFNYYYPEYDAANTCYFYQILAGAPFINADVKIPVRAILYDYNHETFTDVKQGFTILHEISFYDELVKAPGTETMPGVWRNGALVAAVDGPYQDNQKVTALDLTKPAYYLATANSPELNDSQLLSIRWEYQYNAGEFSQFKNSRRSVVVIDGVKKCRIDCSFHNNADTESVQLYAFFNKRDDKIVSYCAVKGKEATALPSGSHVCYITLKEIEDVFGIYSKQKEFRQKIVDALNRYIYDTGKDIHINTALRKAHFFAQVGAETLGINQQWMVETEYNSYTVEGCSVFGQRAKNLKAKNLLATYCSERPQKKLLNYMYAAENGYGNGNGNEQSGDGYKFRGRGLKQLTGRGNYKSASAYLKSFFPDQYIDLEANPDLVKEPKYAVLTAIAFWEKHEIWKLADQLTKPTDDEFKQIRRKVNAGAVGWDSAKTYFQKGITVFEKNCGAKDAGQGLKPGAPGQAAEAGAIASAAGAFNAKDIVTFHVYSDGRVEKHIPKVIKDENAKKYKYVYHDSKGTEHEICTVNWITAQKMNNGKTIYEIPGGYKRTYDYPAGGNAKKAYVYSSGTICVSGTEYGLKKYTKGEGTVQLVRMKDSLSYKKDTVKIFYTFSGSQRRYCNPEAYAGFIGALAYTDRTDVQSTGMCFEDATSYPSVTHPNGDSADTVYLSTLEEEQKKVNGFLKFHFEKIYRGNKSWYPKLKGTAYSDGHNTHLHAGEFNSSKLTIVNEE